MKKFFLALFTIALTIGVSACSSQEELKSPCVGIDDSPCERRNPVKNVV